MLVLEPHSNQVHIPAFDGPLELLLYLIRRKGVDIRFVEIAPITDAYLQHLRQMKSLHLDIAGEFLVLAATLCYLKSCELLPGEHRPIYLDEEEEDPTIIRERLAQQLLEYERYRQISTVLDGLPMLDRDVFTKPEEDYDIPPIPTTDINAMDLLKLYHSLLKQSQEKEPVHQIEKDVFSLHDMGEWLLDQVINQVPTLQECFHLLKNNAQRIVCLLTTLELARHQIIFIEQHGFLQPIHIEANFSERPKLTAFFTEQTEVEYSETELTASTEPK